MGVVLKNGVLVGAANVTPVIGGIITGIKKIEFSTTYNKENEYGLQRQPIGRKRMQQEYPDAKVSILLEEWKAICAAAPNNDPLNIAPFDIPVVYDNNILPQDTLGNCEFKGQSRSVNGGDGSIWVEVDIVWAGLTQ